MSTKERRARLREQVAGEVSPDLVGLKAKNRELLIELKRERQLRIAAEAALGRLVATAAAESGQ